MPGRGECPDRGHVEDRRAEQAARQTRPAQPVRGRHAPRPTRTPPAPRTALAVCCEAVAWARPRSQPPGTGSALVHAAAEPRVAAVHAHRPRGRLERRDPQQERRADRCGFAVARPRRRDAGRRDGRAPHPAGVVGRVIAREQAQPQRGTAENVEDDHGRRVRPAGRVVNPCGGASPTHSGRVSVSHEHKYGPIVNNWSLSPQEYAAAMGAAPAAKWYVDLCHRIEREQAEESRRAALQGSFAAWRGPPQPNLRHNPLPPDLDARELEQARGVTVESLGARA